MARKNAHGIITLNCGLGRDSIAMLCLCIERGLEVEDVGIVRPADLDAVVFSDTGCEWRHTYEVLPAVKTLCEAHGIRFVTLAKAKGGRAPQLESPTSWEELAAKAAEGGYHVETADDDYTGPSAWAECQGSWAELDEAERGGAYHRRADMVTDFQSRSTVASIKRGDCTDNHKIQPIRRWLNDVSKLRFGYGNKRCGHLVRKGLAQQHITLIGIAHDEQKRLAHGGRSPDYVEERYPLVTMGVAKPDEQAILERWGFGHVRKSGCVMCPFQPVSWYWALRETEPAEWMRIVAYEARALERNPKMAVTGAKAAGQPVRLPELVERWRAANPLATIDAVLDKQYSRVRAEARAEQRAELATLTAGVWFVRGASGQRLSEPMPRDEAEAIVEFLTSQESPEGPFELVRA
jgi:hypothetical protein